MNLYEISTQMNELIDPETGEIKDFEAFEELAMAREEKLENTALWIKNLDAEAKAIREEENNLADRRGVIERKIERLKAFLGNALDGQKFSTPKVAVSFRRSTSVNLDDDFIEWAKQNADDLLKFTEPKPDKTAIKKAIKSGAVCHASLVESVSTIIK